MLSMVLLLHVLCACPYLRHILSVCYCMHISKFIVHTCVNGKLEQVETQLNPPHCFSLTSSEILALHSNCKIKFQTIRMTSDICTRTTVNLRGYCLYCLGKISESAQSPAGSPLSSPSRLPFRHYNVHSLALEERLAPFAVLCRYLGVQLPDSYSFGDGIEPEMLSPPLCKKCRELSARLCTLQDELQNMQVKINNTVKRIYQRVTSTCDQRGALKREQFQREFKRRNKGSLSRGRGNSSEMRKVTEMLKGFQMKIIEKENEVTQKHDNYGTTLLSLEQQNPWELEDNENNENVASDADGDFPPVENLRSTASTVNCHVSDSDDEQVRPTKPDSEKSTLICYNITEHRGIGYSTELDKQNDAVNIYNFGSEQYTKDQTSPRGLGYGITTRSQARKRKFESQTGLQLGLT